MRGVEGLMLLQQETAKGHEIKRCCIDSSASWQLGHPEGPAMPLFLRFSAVRVFSFKRVQMKNLTLGIASAFHTAF